MARFGGMTLTRGGRDLMAKALIGKELRFVRVLCGDGNLPEGQVLNEMATLIHPVHEAALQSCITTGAGTARIQAVMTSRGLAMGFHIREVGLFALDPDDGTEVLYSYGNAGEFTDYLEGEGGADVQEYLLSLVIVVDQATQVTAIIDGALVYATREELTQAILDLFKPGAPITGFWTYMGGDDKVLRKATLDEAKRAILGPMDIDSMRRAVEILQNNQAQILMEMELAKLFPDATHMIYEDFLVPDAIDLYTCKVLSVVAGDDSLDCNPVAGMYPGSWYTITDGISYELIRVKSVSIENGIQRVILAAPVSNTYRLENCSLYRTSATIGEGYAMGPTGKLTKSWTPSTVWRGQNANEEALIKLETTVGNSEQFVLDGDIVFTADGLVTLEANT